MKNHDHEIKEFGKAVVTIMATAVIVFANYLRQMDSATRNKLAMKSLNIAMNRQNEVRTNGTKNNFETLAFFMDTLQFAEEVFTVAYRIEVDNEDEETNAILAKLERNLSLCETGMTIVTELSYRID